MRLPDHMIEKWRVFVADIQEKDQTPTVNHISEFIRKRVKAEFDPDFGDLQRDSRTPRNDPPRKGVYATDRDSKKSALKCHVCEEDHRVMECPVIMKTSVPQRLQLAKKAKLCFRALIMDTPRTIVNRRRNAKRVNHANIFIIPFYTPIHQVPLQLATLTQSMQRSLVSVQS